MRAMKVALQPENEAPRRSGKTERGTANYFNNNDTSNNLSDWQVQRVIAVSGVSPALARIIAPLAFEGVA